MAYSPAIAFACFSCIGGIPVLRHDWSWIPERGGFLSNVFATLAWMPNGVGGPRPYPTDYLVALAGTAMVAIAGTTLAYATFMLAIGSLCVYGARSLGALVGSPSTARFGFGAFAIFNPWVYTELVAGHLGMIAAYGASMALAGESLRQKPRWALCALFVCVIAAQLQYLLLALAFVLWLAVARRHCLPLVTGVIVALPAIVGIAGNTRALAGIPYTLQWASAQSLRPIDAAALTGYFADYTSRFSPLAFDAVWAMLALAIMGIVVSKRRTFAVAFSFAALVAWLWSTGSSGPIAPMYVAAIVHFPALEVFRELYDLIGYLVIAYITLAGLSCAVSPTLAKLAVLPGLVLAIAWILAPPSDLWVPARDLPRVAIGAPSHTRLAFLPDVSPMKSGERGSGLDPDAYARPNDVMTVNGPGVPFPADVALRRFAIAGDSADLAAIGVSRIYSRPWLTTDVGNVGPELAIESRFTRRLAAPVTILNPEPELELLPTLRISSALPTLGSGAIFFGDAAEAAGDKVPGAWRALSRPDILKATNRTLRAKDDWVDARLAFLAQPELGQGLGGVVTTSKTAELRIAPGTSALVWVRGRLSDISGQVLTPDTNGYSWIEIPESVNRVRCDGECVIVAQGHVPAGIGPAPGTKRAAPVQFTSPEPWFAAASIGPDASLSLLRYAVGFDPHWLALTSDGMLAHVRIETTLNGWVVPPHIHPQTVVLVEFVAAIQTFLEFVAVMWALGLIVIAIRAALVNARQHSATDGRS